MSSKLVKGSTPIEQTTNTECSPIDAYRKVNFEECLPTPGNLDAKSILGSLTVMLGLPDTKSILGNLAATPELPDTKSILESLTVMPELPDIKSILGNLTVMPELPDIKSILGNLTVMPELPDTKSILGNLTVMPELPDTKSILGNLTVMPELPDTKSILGNLTVMPELPDTKSILESLTVMPEVLNVTGILGNWAATRIESTSGLDSRETEPDCDFNPISCAPTSSEQLMLRAEFEIRLDLAPIPQPIESSAPYASPDPRHSMVLCELERRLRNVIRNRLANLVGPKWVRQRVPPDVRERWQERQDEDRAEGRPVHDLIEYSDFMDLPKIIVQSHNWRDVFEEIFRNAGEIDVSFRRLNPIRRALAHSRPLSQMDILFLTAETSWILGRLRIRVLH